MHHQFVMSQITVILTLQILYSNEAFKDSICRINNKIIFKQTNKLYTCIITG